MDRRSKSAGTNGTPKRPALTPLRQARCEVAFSLVKDKGGVAYLDCLYEHNCDTGLTAGQLDTALDDLAHVGKVAISGTNGSVKISLVEEPSVSDRMAPSNN